MNSQPEKGVGLRRRIHGEGHSSTQVDAFFWLRIHSPDLCKRSSEFKKSKRRKSGSHRARAVK